ncbi:30S ribosomal protein S16 [Patescibacteria group bacterium]|nr:30S ribosomal protein S16 [Patescibacteria group bacterium]
MSVTIRLAKFGKKNAPAYRIVVSTTKDKRNGKFHDILGFYNPASKQAPSELDAAKYDEWVKKGALVSSAVKSIVAGTYTYKKYSTKKSAQKAESQEAAE